MPWHGVLLFAGALLIATGGIRLPVDGLTMSGGSAVVESGWQRSDTELLERFGPQETLLLRYRPQAAQLLSDGVLARIAGLRDALAGLPGVHRVTTLLDVPLLFSPQIRPIDIGGDLLRVADPGVDVDMARDELRDNPLYHRLLLSDDGGETALRIVLGPRAQRDALLDAVREVIEPWRADADLLLVAPGPAAVDAERPWRTDALRDGAAVLALGVLLLALLLRSLPLGLLVALVAVAGALLAAGVLGWAGRTLDEEALAALALVVSCVAALALRVVVESRRRTEPVLQQRVAGAVRGMLPRFGFALVVATAGGCLMMAPAGGMRVVDSASMAAAGVLAALVATPLLLVIVSATRRRAPLVSAAVLVLCAIAVALPWLDGATAPDASEAAAEPQRRHDAEEFGGADALYIVLRDDSGRVGVGGSANPWFSAAGMRRLQAVHDYLQRLDGVASVRSLARLGQAAALLHGHAIGDPELAALWQRLPEPRRRRLLGSSLSATTPEALLVVGARAFDAQGLRDWRERSDTIHRYLLQELGFTPGQVEIHAVGSTVGAARMTRTSAVLAIGPKAAVVTALFLFLVLWPLPSRARAADDAGSSFG